jgi:hypothetical protein
MAGIFTATNPYPDSPINNSLEVGAEFQDFAAFHIARQLGINIQIFSSKKFQYSVGESLQGWEFKLDNGMIKYNHLSIEVAEKTNLNQLSWIPSGIYRSDNTHFYVHGNYEYFYLFMKKILVLLHKSGRYGDDHEWQTVKKFYLPILDADKYGIKVVPKKL